MLDLYSHLAFAAALTEIEALGFRVSDRPSPGTTPYGIVGGRSNSRWWLISLANRRVSASGMALFQPILTSAKLIKNAAVTASALGLSSLWVKQKLYITGTPCLSEMLGSEDLHFAFFTGTDCPHRKVAVQIMDSQGGIKGFAKVTQSPSVKPLLAHEAETLNHLQTLEFLTAQIPKVLFSGTHGDASLLVTDTLKKPSTKTTTSLNQAHLAFLAELAKKTAAQETDSKDWLAKELAKRYAAVSERVPNEWQSRIEWGVDYISKHSQDMPPPSLSHGDFTPWNTFFVDGRLYVFDWEYADHIYPSGYDLIHFILALPDTNRQSTVSKVELVVKALREADCASSPQVAKAIFLAYLCGHTLHYIGRESMGGSLVNLWDGAEKIAALFDELIDQRE